MLSKFHQDGFSPKETMHGLQQKFFGRPYWVYWKVKRKILYIVRNIDFLITNKCSTALKTIQILHKSYSDVNQYELIFYFKYVLQIIHLYKNLNQWKGFLIPAKYRGLYYFIFYFVEFFVVHWLLVLTHFRPMFQLCRNQVAGFY